MEGPTALAGEVCDLSLGGGTAAAGVSNAARMLAKEDVGDEFAGRCWSISWRSALAVEAPGVSAGVATSSAGDEHGWRGVDGCANVRFLHT